MTKSCKNCNWAEKDEDSHRVLLCNCPLPLWSHEQYYTLTEPDYDLAEHCYYYDPKLDKPTACFDCDHYDGVQNGVPYCNFGPRAFNPLYGSYYRQRISVWQKNTNGKCPDFKPKQEDQDD